MTTPAVAPSEVPPHSEISRRLHGARFHDCYRVRTAQAYPSAMALYLQAVSRTPAWVDALMAARNRVVGLAGLKNLGHLGAVSAGKPASAYRVGDRVGIFSLLHLTPGEVILGDADKHLEVQVSVCLVEGGAAFSTVVHIRNTLGRVYMLFVAPVHKIIVRRMLARLAG